MKIHKVKIFRRTEEGLWRENKFEEVINEFLSQLYEENKDIVSIQTSTCASDTEFEETVTIHYSYIPVGEGYNV